MTTGTLDKQEAGGTGVKSKYKHRKDGKMVLQKEYARMEGEAYFLPPE